MEAKRSSTCDNVANCLFVENEHTALFRATLILIVDPISVDPEQRKKHSFKSRINDS